MKILFFLLAIITSAYAEDTTIETGTVPENNKKTQKFIFCIEGYPQSLNPQFTFNMTSFFYDQPIFETLVHFGDSGFELKPGLAESWSVSADKTEYTFVLRKGVKFHTTDKFTPTRDMNAEDVFFSFDKQFNQGNEYHAKTNNRYVSFEVVLAPILKEIKVIDSYTIKFILHKPYAFFLGSIASNYAAVMSLEYAQQLKEKENFADFDNYPVGTGPFKLANYENGSYNYEINKDYWGQKAKHNLVFQVVENTNVRYQKLIKGECHLMNYPNIVDTEEILSNNELYLISKKVPSISYLVFNTSKPALSKIEVRKAISMAINKLDILALIYQSMGEYAVSPFSSSFWNVNEDISYIYDRRQAKSILISNDLKDLELELYISESPKPYNPNPRKMAELIKRDLQNVGIKVNISSFEPGEFLRRVKESKHDLVLGGMATDSGNPLYLLRSYLSCKSMTEGRNHASWCNARFDSIVEELEAASSTQRQEEILRDLLEIFEEQQPWLPLVHPRFIALASKKATKIKLNNALFYRFNYLELEEK